MSNKMAGLGFFPAFSIVILSVGIMNHVIVIPPLLHAAKRDAWMSVLLTIPPYLIWTAFLYYIMSKTKQLPLIPWLQHYYGKTVVVLFKLFFVLYLFVISEITIRETGIWAHTSYLPRTPLYVITLSLILLCFFAAWFGIQAIAICSGVMLPFVLVFGDFVMSANLPKKNYSLLRPIFEDGMGPALQGALYVGGGLAEFILILLFQHQLKKKLKYWQMVLLAIALVMLVFGPVTGAIAEFGPYEASELRYPSFEEWRLVQVGKYIQHVDFLSIYQWLSGSFVRIAISMYLIMELLPAKLKKHRTLWLAALAIVMMGLMQVPFSDMQYLYFLKTYYLPVSVSVATGVLLVLFVMVLLAKNKTGVNRNEK